MNTTINDLPPAPAELFPAPLRPKHYLWAHHWEDLDDGLYSRPGQDVGDTADRVPSIGSLLELQRHPCLELEAA